MRLRIRLLGQAFRRLTRNPGFTITSALMLGLAMGANSAIFGLIEGILLKPLPFPHQERMVAVLTTAPGVGIKDLNASAADFLNYREENSTFAEIGMWNGGYESVIGVGEPERVRTLTVTARLLPILGFHPVLGRTINRQDDTPGAPDVVLLSYGYWRRKFGGDRQILGRSIEAGGIVRQIVGVLPQSFWLLDQKPDLILPLKLDRSKVTMGAFHFHAIALLKPGVTLTQASADVARMIPLERKKFPMFPGMSIKVFDDARFAPNVRPLKQEAIGDIGKTLWVMMTTVGLLLLIACANVGNLMLVRIEGRQQEFAVRAALGAGWPQIAQEVLLETITLSFAAGVVGLPLAAGALQLLVAFPPAQLPRVQELSVNGAVVLFNFAVALFSGILFGSIPVARYVTRNLTLSLRSEGRTFSQGRERGRTQSLLVIVQIALALVLSIGSGLMIRTFQSMRRVQPGVRITDTLQTARLVVTGIQGRAPEQTASEDQAILDRLAAVPGVQSAGIGTILPMTGDDAQAIIVSEDHPYQVGRLPPLRRLVSITPGFLQTMGIPLLAGRDLNWTDVHEIRPVAIVSENFAREYWGSARGALGKRIHEIARSRWSEIVGVVGNVHHEGVDHVASSSIYWPLLSRDNNGRSTIPDSANIVIFSERSGSQSFVDEIRSAVWAVNPNLPIADVRTMSDIYAKSMARTSFTLVLLLLAGAMALLIGTVGIFATVSYSVLQRTREMGIRIALGATASELKFMFVRRGMLLAIAGVSIGLAAAIGVERLMTAVLFQISPFDPATYGVVSLVFLAAIAFASYLATFKGVVVDPVVALRGE